MPPLHPGQGGSPMNATYLIVGGDGRRYGPAPAEEIGVWIGERRADAATLVQVEGSSAWQRLDAVAELEAFLPARAPEGRPVPGGPGEIELPTEAELLQRDYRLRILEIFADGWRLFSRQFGALFGAAAFVALGMIALALASLIPFVALLTAPVSIVIAGPMVGGLWHVFVRAWRGNVVRAKDVFGGFRGSFARLFLLHLAITLFSLIATLPLLVPLAVGFGRAARQGGIEPAGFWLLVAGFAAMATLSMVLWSLWGYAFELVMDRGLGVRAAMKLSRRVVSRHPVRNLLFFVASGLILTAGFLLCFVGILFAVPWVVASYARAYEELFGPRPHLANPAA